MTEIARETINQDLDQLVERLRATSGTNLHSVVLYGSAASPDFHEKFSDVNVLCLFQDLSAATVMSISGAMEWWTKKKHSVPLLLSVDELRTSADVFPIELLDMQKHHRTIYGDDLIATLEVPLRLHRLQLEHDLRTKLILLRQRFVVVSRDNKKLLNLALESLSTFLTLFRHALIATGESPDSDKRRMLEQLQRKFKVEVGTLLDLLAVREGARKPESLDASSALQGYVAAIERMIAVVDRL